MRKIFFRISTLILISIIFIYCDFSTSSSSNNEEISNSEDTLVIITPTIDEIIIDGIPNDTTQFKKGISYETDDYIVIEDTVAHGQTISHILKKYNLKNTK